MMSLSIRPRKIITRLMILVVAPVVVLSLFYTAHTIQERRSDATISLKKYALQLAENIALNSTTALISGNKIYIKDTVDGLAENNEVQGILVGYKDGHVLYEIKKTVDRKSATFTVEKDVVHRIHAIEQPLGGDSLNEPQKQIPQILGFVRVTTNDSGLRQAQGEIIKEDVLIGGLTTVIVVVLGLIIGRSTNKRIYSLSKAIASISSDNHIQARESGDDEIAELGRHVNRVQKTLKDAEAELQKHIEDLVNARNDADRANAEKHDFLGQISNEVIAPLQEINHQIDNLTQLPLSPVAKSHVDAALFQIEYLDVLHRDLLEFYLQNTSRLSITNRYFNVMETIDRIIQSFTTVAKNKSVELITDYSGNTRLRAGFIFSDPIRFHQILKELIQNALNYTMAGAVRVHVHLREDSGQTATVTVEVIDTGIGIASDRQAQIFELLHGSSPYDIREAGTTGLVMAGRTANMIGGTLTLRSKVDTGSVFTFEVTTPFSSTPVQNTEESRTSVATRAAVLFIALSNEGTNSISTLLGLKLNVDVVMGHDLGISKYKSKHYDIILFEADSKTGEGFSAAQTIRDLNSTKLSPMIAIVNEITHAVREQADKLGINHVLERPVSRYELYRKIDENIRFNLSVTALFDESSQRN